MLNYIGFTFETVADAQLLNFKQSQDLKKVRFYKQGLWRYSRHPNYFGEALVWWGIWVIACSIKWGWASFFAPLLTTLVLRFVTGVPMLEEPHLENPEFILYQKETNALLPWFPKTNVSTQPSEVFI